ncbi:SDR family oxidoreductase [Pseudoxanthomonas sp. JBR18]|uniref:SDR family oxidoreductase n=1 Tax=Pseudoxanthomonas sp. JBR18 TaxID=2969308 RepID=UPI002304D1D4|nr:SDR family oxidoreductase [Pseudoxanthomonas sp. JBR18]WCE05886.1 SDR family oxidoreductase [Pseudoxanthomonas sp. JBR18]
MSLKLNNKIALVTGGTTGIGLETARQFALEGATVYVTGRRKEQLDAAVASIGANAKGIQVDSAKLGELAHLAQTIKADHGRLDVLFVNAGGGSLVPLGEITEAHFDDTFDRNVKGTLFTVQALLPVLAEGASVMLTGSTAGSTGSPGFSVYGASKAAVRALVRNWILEVDKARKLRFNILAPGPTRTPGLVELAGPDAGQQQGLLDFLATQVPLGRVGEPIEIARAAVFLASDDASFVNGAELFVDGGQAQV